MNTHVFAENGSGLKFVGDFAALYAAEEDPWSQSGDGPMGDYYRLSRQRLLECLRRLSSGPGLEIGCGHGHVTAMLQHRLCRRMIGMDISAAAIAKAKEFHPHSHFMVGDITAVRCDMPRRFGFVVWGQILWYVLHQMDAAVDNTLRTLEPGGIFAISQAFLPEQRYGNDVVDGFEGAVWLFVNRYSERLRLIEARYDDAGVAGYQDGLLVFRAL